MLGLAHWEDLAMTPPREALEQYLWAEELDDPAIRDGELAVARQNARVALSETADLK